MPSDDHVQTAPPGRGLAAPPPGEDGWTPPYSETESSFGEEQAQEAEQSRDALAGFLSVDPNRQLERKPLFIDSMNTTVVLEELSEKTIDDIYKKYDDDIENAAKRKKARAKGRQPERMPRNRTDMSAELVAASMVEPNLRDETVRNQICAHFGVPSILMALQKSMKGLELSRLAAKVLEISGADDDAIQDLEEAAGE